MYLINDTLYKETLDEYNESRPACLIIVIDSYDELFDDMKDSEQAKELEAINSLLEKYIGRSTGFLRKVTNSRYIAVVEERDVRWMLAERFDILDKVRALHPGGLTTLSIGVGHGGKTLQECHQMARESIDIALGRGGDQAAVKTVDGFEFYGGISHGVEKRSHVRSRIIANALCDLIKRSDSVIIMGHRMSDLDAVGSAIGVLRICKMCDVPAVIAINSEATLAGPLLKTFLDAGEGHDFIAPDQTLDVITPNTLLIVVDTYQKRLLESQQIYERCKRVVVIGRSLVIGKPVSLLLLAEHATVTICHSRSENLPEICREADILVVAAGKAGMVGAESVRAGQVVLDVGIHVGADGNLCGDTRFAEVEPVVEAITPVPGGVGTVTSTILASHVVEAAERAASK